MRIFILSAGIGSRLWPLTKETPKSLLALEGGECVLQQQISTFTSVPNITGITIITGYRSKQIENFVRGFNMNSQIKVEVCFNPFFKISNNLMSIWMVKEKLLGEDFIITNGDNLYRQEILNDLQLDNPEEGIFLTVNKKEDYDDDDMKVILDQDLVSRVHKGLEISKVGAESVGLTKIVGEKSRKLFYETINNLGYEEEYLNKFWLEIFNRIVECGYPIKTLETKKEYWQELDFHPDLDMMNRLLNKINFKISS